jgi:RND superfamily putative drug exporter
VSADGRVAVLRLHYPVIEELSPADLENLKAVVAEAREGSPLRIEMGGDLFFAFEEAEAGIGELLGLAVAAGILLLAFGSLVAMGLPIASALLGLVIGIAALSLVTHLVDVPTWAPVIGTMVGLGVGIDYALFLVTRHREHLASGMPVEESVGRAVATAGRAVICAGGTVVVAILGLAVAGVPFVTAGGVAVSVIVLVMVAVSVTLVPALIGLAGPRIGGRRRGRVVPPDAVVARSRWRQWGRHVTGHAGAYAVGGVVCLLALSAPVLSLRVGNPDDGTLPETRTERRAYDLVAAGFGPGTNGPLVVAVDAARDPQVRSTLHRAVRATEGIAAVSPPDTLDEEAGVTAFVAYPTTGPQDPATAETIERLRHDTLPGVLDGTTARAHVGGQTATFADVAGQVEKRLPYFVTAVVLLSFLLLTLVFRSAVVALKAALLNLLSIGAAYGVLVMVFQWGWGAGLIGLESTVPVISFIPLFMFAILFGLSMDYEVFLLSRVREEYDRTGDSDAAVVHGLASTARVITAGALIMVSVFLGFVASDDPFAKMFGVGLATAILVDATVVRMVLVPATMTLLGSRNWWLPAWLDRLLPVAAPAPAVGAHCAPDPEPLGVRRPALGSAGRP